MTQARAAITRHIVDAAFEVSLAAVVIIAAWSATDAYCEMVIGWLGRIDLVYTVVAVISLSALLGWSAQKQVMASFRSLKLLPRHCGLVFRVTIGSVLTLSVACLTGLLKVPRGQMPLLLTAVIGLETLVLSIAVALAKLHLWLLDRSKHIEKIVEADDRPIHVLEDNLFPENEAMARRILSQFELGGSDQTRGPNVALIGPYGSGKTSLCNLIEDISRRGQGLIAGGTMVFCHFEAWQFLAPDAAVRGLLDQIVNKVQELVDCSGLGSMAEEYVDTLRACPNEWLGMIAAVLRKRRNPEDVIQSVQDVLLRIGKRVVVFVDDFDRLEDKSKEIQQAIAVALNQLQNLTNVQYVLCVGPMLEGPGADLLKLTRFQELMPEVQGEEVIERLRGLRDESVRADPTMYYPWDLGKEGNDDPLKYYPHREQLGTTLVSKLVRLIQKPRQVRAVEREIREKWNGGLKGEISWYDLLLMSTLKIAEPRVFEWILRDQDVFLDEEIRISEPTEQQKKEAADKIERRLREFIQVKTDARFKLVLQVLRDLFPNFMKELDGLGEWLSRADPQLWEQCIALRPNYGTSYFRRYVLGKVASEEVPDQPTLQYIHKIINDGFEPREFEQRYLESHQRLANNLNRFVQYSALLSGRLARRVCECMLDWMCDRDHWSVWPQGEEYVSCLMVDVKHIVDRAGQFEHSLARRRGHHNAEESVDSGQWIESQIKNLVSKDKIVAIEYAIHVAKDVLGERDVTVTLAALFKKKFLEDQEVFWAHARGHHSYMSRLLGFLRGSDDYDSIRDQVTQSVLTIAKADNSGDFVGSVILSLVTYMYPASRPDLVDAYQFKVNKAENHKTFNMDMLLPALLRWKDRQFEDQVVTKAFAHLMSAYAEEMRGLQS